MDILNQKIIVCTSLKEVRYAKVNGELNLNSLYFYDIVSCYLKELKCCSDSTSEEIRKLEDLLVRIKYSTNVSDYKIKDLKSFKNVVHCNDCVSGKGFATSAVNINNGDSQIKPTVDDIEVDLMSNDYSFKFSDFTKNFNSYGQGEPENVRINTLPPLGRMQYNNQNIEPGFVLNINDVGLLKFNVMVDLDTDFGFVFQTSNSNNLKTYSNMATFTFNVDAYVNQPPSEVGDRTVTIPNSSTYVITAADFTTLTVPVYADPENDPVANVKITLLPTSGTLQLNGSNVTLNQVIAFSDVQAGRLTYVSNPGDRTEHSTTFEFELSDTGSNTFVS